MGRVLKQQCSASVSVRLLLQFYRPECSGCVAVCRWLAGLGALPVLLRQQFCGCKHPFCL